MASQAIREQLLLGVLLFAVPFCEKLLLTLEVLGVPGIQRLIDMWLCTDQRFSQLTATTKDLFYMWSMACNYGLQGLLKRVQCELASCPEIMCNPKDSNGKPLLLGCHLQGEGIHVGMESMQKLIQCFAKRSVLGHGHKISEDCLVTPRQPSTPVKF